MIIVVYYAKYMYMYNTISKFNDNNEKIIVQNAEVYNIIEAMSK